LRFNPWWFNGQRSSGSRLSSRRLALRYPKRLTDTGKQVVCPFRGPKISRFSTYKDAAITATDDGWQKALAEILLGGTSVEDEHENLAKALRKQAKSFLIVIDDIDRLSPEEALLVFSWSSRLAVCRVLPTCCASIRLATEEMLRQRFPSEGPQVPWRRSFRRLLTYRLHRPRICATSSRQK